jgi:hypothetical protein
VANIYQCGYLPQANSATIPLPGFRRGPCSGKQVAEFVGTPNPPQFPECKERDKSAENDDTAEQVVQAYVAECTYDVLAVDQPLNYSLHDVEGEDKQTIDKGLNCILKIFESHENGA